jgi:hypothetical protein
VRRAFAAASWMSRSRVAVRIGASVRVERLRVAVGAGDDPEVRLERLRELVVGEDAARAEAAEDAVRALRRPREAGRVPGVHAAGRLREAGEEGRLRPREVLRRLVEVELRRPHDAVDAVPVRGEGQVLAEDLLVADVAHEEQRFRCFLGLSENSAALRGLEAGDLHREGGGAGDDLEVREILPGGAENGGRVDAGVLVEVAVLGLDGGADDLLGEHVRRRPRADGAVGAGDLTEVAAAAVDEELRPSRGVEAVAERVPEQP